MMVHWMMMPVVIDLVLAMMAVVMAGVAAAVVAVVMTRVIAAAVVTAAGMTTVVVAATVVAAVMVAGMIAADMTAAVMAATVMAAMMAAGVVAAGVMAARTVAAGMAGGKVSTAEATATTATVRSGRRVDQQAGSAQCENKRLHRFLRFSQGQRTPLIHPQREGDGLAGSLPTTFNRGRLFRELPARLLQIARVIIRQICRFNDEMASSIDRFLSFRRRAS
jgi:hypothetical protein